MNEGPRKCDCGCKRPAVLYLLTFDLAFSTKCLSRYVDGYIKEADTLRESRPPERPDTTGP